MALTTSSYAQLKSLKNMRIRSKESEDKRREKWMQKTQGYLEKREERRDSMPPLRTDSHRNVGQTRSRSVSRTRSYRPRAETPKPPPAPARAPVTPPQGPTAASKPVRYKAAPVSLKQPSGPKSSSSAQPPVKAPPVPPPGRSSGSTRQPSTPPDPPGPPKTPPPWRERSQQAEQRQTTRKRPINVPEPPAPPSRMTGTQWLDQGTASSSSGYRNYGYYDQPAYYRANPRTSNVEYVPGYQVPRQRWVQKYDGSWLDLIPQTPDQSIPASSQTILFLVVWARNAFAPLAALFYSESTFDVLRVLAQLSLHLQGSVFAKLQINRVKLPKCHPLPWGVPLTQASQSKSVWLYSIKIFWIDLGSAMILKTPQAQPRLAMLLQPGTLHSQCATREGAVGHSDVHWEW